MIETHGTGLATRKKSAIVRAMGWLAARRRVGGLWVALLAAMGAQPSLPARAQEQPAAVIIVDASGSMAAPLQGTRLPKIGLAREALARSLPRIAGETRIGLAAFGHRRGDCADIEIMRPAEPVDPARVAQLLEKVSPRGRGPVAQALRVAARELPQTTAPRSLILIHDDADNCAADLCAVAAELAKARITVHAVGLALKPEDRPKMACLAQITGGKLYNATTPEQVGAAIEEALKLAAAGALTRPAPQLPLEGAEAQATVPDTAPPGLYLRARLSAGSDLLRQPLQWTVLPDGENTVAVFAAQAVNPYLALAPGRYAVEVRDGPVEAHGAVTVAKDKPTALTLSVEAGTLRARVASARGGLTFPAVLVTVARPPAGTEPALQAAPGEAVSAFTGMDGALTLPAGRYVVRAEAGLVRAQQVVTVTAGGEAPADLVLDAGLLQISAGNTAAATPTIVAVIEDDPDAPRGRREIVRSAERAPTFVLPPGTYTIELRQAGVEVRERVAIVSGEMLRRTLTLSAGQVTLSSRLSAQPITEHLFYSIERIDGGGSDVVTTSKPQPTLLLAAGRYRIEGRYGTINARVVREVDVRPGAPVQQIVFEQTAGTVRLKAQSAPGEVFWEIRDGGGRQVWSTGHPEPELTLQAGQYTVRASARDKQAERTFELRAGERRALDVSFE